VTYQRFSGVETAESGIAMATKTMTGFRDGHFRTAYKVEELLALRDSVSESAVSLDKFPTEDAIKGTFALIPYIFYAWSTSKA
jgi:hypothetical protein